MAALLAPLLSMATFSGMPFSSMALSKNRLAATHILRGCQKKIDGFALLVDDRTSSAEAPRVAGRSLTYGMGIPVNRPWLTRTFGRRHTPEGSNICNHRHDVQPPASKSYSMSKLVRGGRILLSC
jgi:hypothetical protein